MNKDIKNIENIEHLCTLYDKFQSFLTQTQNQAFQLYFFENLSYSEIAEITATTRSAAYDSVNKAIKKLLNLENKIS
ncbi:sigma factor-like helix-turn-helix DNA-binding protein [Mycoplasmopsis felifaucium]|uniref:sigma factor-like helix-turn-helix DNA-binding protein n=1 Tax=Mycoplasmopsis felifaucium TaxID=35768 RepID=UPI000486DD67|nr:sigma factor-like helix-turn-helix DNA-binding protein [Mycoplasmopsis felifaucium]